MYTISKFACRVNSIQEDYAVLLYWIGVLSCVHSAHPFCSAFIIIEDFCLAKGKWVELAKQKNGKLWHNKICLVFLCEAALKIYYIQLTSLQQFSCKDQQMRFKYNQNSWVCFVLNNISNDNNEVAYRTESQNNKERSTTTR